jgi:hypothetical protein
MERDLFDGLGDLGADTVAGKESGSDRRGDGGEGPGNEGCVGVRVCGGGEDISRASSESATKELGSHDQLRKSRPKGERERERDSQKCYRE